MKRFLLILILTAGAFAQPMKMTVDQLESFVRSSVQLRHDDRKVAEYLRKVQVTEKITEKKFDELLAAGAGPRTMEVLRGLRDSSAKLAEPVPPRLNIAEPGPRIAAPNSLEQARVLAETREYALNYIRKLPDFICLQVTRRYYDPSGLEFWKLADTISEQLTFFEQRENYKVNTINGSLVTVSHEQLDGASSSGEFGSMLKEIFAPESQTDFQWERWATLRARRMHVFSFRVAQARSKYRIVYRRSQSFVSGYRGLVYVDSQTGVVMRIKMECENIPPDFPVQQVSNDLNYEFQKIGESEFVLPLKAELRSREGKFLIKNEAEFRLYRKFGSESTIKFDTPEPLPEDATKEKGEKPATAPAKPETPKPTKKKK